MSDGIMAFYTNPTPESGIFDVGIQAIHQYSGENTYVGFSISYFDGLEKTFYNLQSDGSWSQSGDYSDLNIITGEIGASGTAYFSNITENASYIRVSHYDNMEISTEHRDELILRGNFSYGYINQSGVCNYDSNNNGYYAYNSFGN